MKAVIFDFNGTLFDDTEFHVSSWQIFMREKFGLDFTRQEIHSRFIGPNNPTIFHTLFGDRFSAKEIAEFGKEKEVTYRRSVRSEPDHMHLIEGACELFDLLKARGIPFTIATGSGYENVDFYLKELNLNRWLKLEDIVYDACGLPSKPNPDYFLEAARRLNTPIEDCIVVEDSPSGFAAAANAGAGRIIAIDRTLAAEVLMQRPEIHAVVHDFTSFEKFL